MSERGALKFEYNLGVDKGCLCTKFGGAHLRNRDSTDQKSTKNGQF